MSYAAWRKGVIRQLAHDEMKCGECIWSEDCDKSEDICGICSDFSPFDETEDRYVDMHIETERAKFYEEWFEYIGAE